MEKFLVFLTVVFCILRFTEACPRSLKNVFSPDATVEEPGCYYAEGMFINADSGTSVDILNGDPLKCRQFCKDNGYESNFVIMQQDTCHCNKAFRHHAKRDKSNCDISCLGDSTYKCGGKNHASGYIV
ncbi:hypothetical protein BOX15_Mlig004834g1 [Macrostomum lignano]|uniref:WSC domain-containing protein n=1 Tax=Macrostomum lignano TaxID=282301 RepID=A0A267F7S4_9PLAT|nr:hypothetical protein BOX15_Mlig004834g2 [Macrostomum lignano]PAA69072.1 hypothetical protein BOX15_Mlig004834g1 [Macrostomum lignano]